MKNSNKTKAQSFLDYAIFISMVIVAFSVMFFFFRNYTAGRIRSGSDTIGHGEQYEPSNLLPVVGIIVGAPILLLFL